MAIISGSLALLGAGAKALAGGMSKKAATGAAKKFVTGSGKKKKKDGGVSEGKSQGKGGAFVKKGSSGITPSAPMVAGSTGSESSGAKVQPVGKVSFESITKQLNSIASLSSQLQSQSSADLKGKEKALSNARVATAKAKSREKEEKNENKGGALSFLGNKAKQAGEGLGIFNFLKNILLGIGALSLMNNANKIINGLKFLGQNLHNVWLGIKGIGLVFKSVGKNLPVAFKSLKINLGKFAKPVTNKFKALKTGIKAVVGKLGKLIPGFINQGFNKIAQASKALSQGITSTGGALGRAATFNTRGKSLGKTSAGLSKLLGNAGTGGAGAASNLGGRTNMYTLSKKARSIRAKHGNAAAEMYQQAINSGKTPKRAMLNVRKKLGPGGKLTSAPMKGSLGGGIGGSKVMKKGFKVAGKRVLIKFMGKGGAKVALKALSNIPVVGPLIVAVTSLLSGEPVSQALFKAGGALLGGILGSFIPIPIVGTLLGELVGEYVGDLMYTLFMGGGVDALGQRLKDDITAVMSVGAKALDWVKGGFGRFYKGIPKIKIPFIDKGIPDPSFFLNPFNMKKQLDLFWKAFFTDKPMGKGKEKKKTAESEAKRKQTEKQQAALRRQKIDTSKMDPSIAGWIERQKQLDIDSGLVPDPNGPFVLRGPDGKPLVLGQSAQKQGGGQQKLALLAYGTNEWSMSRTYIKAKTKDLIKKLMDKGYKVIVIPPSPGLRVNVNPKGKDAVIKDPHFGVVAAAGEMKAKVEIGQYSENDPLGKYVHLNPRYAKSVKAKYKPDIVVGDSNAALINGGQSVTAKDGASYTTVSDMIGGLSKQSTQPTQPTQQRTSNSGPTRVMGNPTLSSQYGEMRGSQMHGGTDIAATPGAPLVPVTDATIVDYGKLSQSGAKRGDPYGWGNFIVYKDSQGYYHLYGHILESGMKTSGSVKKGEPIAKVGSTGKSSGPHLHWEMGTSWSGGALGGKMDPLSVYKVNDPFTVGGRMSDNSETREVNPTVTNNNKPLTVPMDQQPGENAPQAEIDEYFRKLEAGELTGTNPYSQAQVSPTTPPASQSSSVESQASYEQNNGGSVVVMPPPSSPAQSSGGSRSKGGVVTSGSGNVLNSYYKAQLLGFLYKFG